MAKNRDDNLDYWRKREEEARQNTIKDEAEYNKRLDGIYNSMQVNIEKEINGFYSRYATKNGISMAEAKKRVQNADMEALSRKAEKYVREKDFSDKANEEMALYNLAMKTNRLELLKAQIELELIDGFNDVEHEMEKDLLKTSMKEYERMAGILGKSVKDAEKHAHELVNTSFRNAHFSDRVWYSEWSLKVELERLLRIGLIQGRNPNVLMRDVEKALKVSKYEARRVMVTEMCRVQTGAQKQTYERNGYEQYTFIVEHDDRLCDDCRDLDGQVFYVKDMAPGHNAPPIHPFCRCSTSAYADRSRLDALIAQIEAERKGGKAGGESEYKPAKNIGDAEKFARNYGVKYVNYEKLPLETANALNEALSTLPDGTRPLSVSDSKQLESWWGSKLRRKAKEYFGVTIEDFDGVHLGMGNFDGLNDRGYMVAISSAWKNLSKIQNEKESFNERYSQRHDGHSWYFNETGYTVPAHEIGHVYANINGIPKGFEADSARWAKESKCDMLNKPSEAWAEAWASYHTGLNVDRVPDYILDYVKKVSKK